jgi:hypothetical protein
MNNYYDRVNAVPTRRSQDEGQRKKHFVIFVHHDVMELRSRRDDAEIRSPNSFTQKIKQCVETKEGDSYDAACSPQHHHESCQLSWKNNEVAQPLEPCYVMRPCESPKVNLLVVA